MLGLREKTQTHTPPAKHWRNYYRVYHVLSMARMGTIFPGIHGGPDTFPSKEIAEEHALVFLKMLNPPGRYFMDLAGTYPEGEPPN